ncbi:13713_t:CDS:2 [Ambispora leptoticha]|uniref:13713_t:CDS:1 n=1 Tax=Ambispora leptoticha TaxID=144679 RepID=A0A9N9GQV9_9GLOM|nr:13713_t:CDS:2 [Ambispora leptoticha]
MSSFPAHVINILSICVDFSESVGRVTSRILSSLVFSRNLTVDLLRRCVYYGECGIVVAKQDDNKQAAPYFSSKPSNPTTALH